MVVSLYLKPYAETGNYSGHPIDGTSALAQN